jgi:hypothetical protein
MAVLWFRSPPGRNCRSAPSPSFARSVGSVQQLPRPEESVDLFIGGDNIEAHALQEVPRQEFIGV